MVVKTVEARAEGVDLTVTYNLYDDGNYELDVIRVRCPHTNLYEVVSEGVRNTCECAVRRAIEDKL